MKSIILAILLGLSIPAFAIDSIDIDGIVKQAVKFHAPEVIIEGEMPKERVKELFYALEEAGFKVDFTFKQNKKGHITYHYKLHSINGN